MERAQGYCEAISIKNNSVLIDGQWYNLASQVKISYIKKGPVEYDFEQSEDPSRNPILTFCRNSGVPGQYSQPKSQASLPKPDTVINSETNNPQVVQSEMCRMAALKFAGNVFQGTGKVEEAKELTNEAHEYLMKGMWIAIEKIKGTGGTNE